MDKGSVLPRTHDVTEQEFQAAMVLGLSRAERALGGQRALAAAMDLSTKQVSHILNGRSGTDPKRLFDVNLAAPGALDDIAALYGWRPVPTDAICTTDKGKSSITVVGLLTKLMEAEADGTIDHTELLGMEDELRAVRAIVDRKLAAIADLRRPRVAA